MISLRGGKAIHDCEFQSTFSFMQNDLIEAEATVEINCCPQKLKTPTPQAKLWVPPRHQKDFARSMWTLLLLVQPFRG